MTRKTLCALAVLFCLLPATLAWAQAQPSLGDVAGRKPAAKAKRVITNDEIPPTPEAVAPPAAAPDAASAAEPAPTAKADAEKHDAKPPTPAEKQAKLQELMKEQESLQKIKVRLQQQIESTNDQNVITTLSGMMEHASEQVAANQQEIDKLEASGAGQGESPTNPSQPPVQPKPPE